MANREWYDEWGKQIDELVAQGADEETIYLAVDQSIKAMNALPEEEQSKVATQAFLKFKKFIDKRISDNK